MDLQRLSKITIGDIVDFSSIMPVSIKDAIPKISEFKLKHNLEDKDIKNLCRVVISLGLYS